MLVDADSAWLRSARLVKSALMAREAIRYGELGSPDTAKARPLLGWKGVAFAPVELVPIEAWVVLRRLAKSALPVLAFGPERFGPREIAPELDTRFPDKPVLSSDPAEQARAQLFEEWVEARLSPP